MGTPAGFPVEPGYNVSTTFDVTVADGAPIGDYTITLELIDVDDPATVLASETGTITVNDNTATVLWGDSVPKLATQGVTMTIPLQVYSPVEADGALDLAVTGPGDDPLTPDVVEELATGNVKIYASDGTDMVAMPLTLDEGALVGTWDAALVAGYNPVTWYTTVAVGAPVGNYAFDVSLRDGITLATPLVVSVSAPDAHGEKPPGVGDDTTAPTVTITAVDTLGSTASFDLTASEDGVSFTCKLTTNGVPGPWESCKTRTTYSDLEPGTYIFSALPSAGSSHHQLARAPERWRGWMAVASPLASLDSPRSSVQVLDPRRSGTCTDHRRGCPGMPANRQAPRPVRSGGLPAWR